MKTRRYYFRLAQIVVYSLCAGALNACFYGDAKEIKIKNPYPIAQSLPRIPLHVALVNDVQFTGYVAPNLFHPKLGDPLRRYSESTVRAVFEDVNVFIDEALAATQAQIILHPRIERSEAYRLSGERKLYLVVEWTMKNKDNKQILWLSTIMATATEPSGSDFTAVSRERNLIEKTFDDLTNKTIAAMRESPEIKRLVIEKER